MYGLFNICAFAIVKHCVAQDGKNGRGQPSSFIVLSQIFTQSYRRVEREFSCPGNSML